MILERKLFSKKRDEKEELVTGAALGIGVGTGASAVAKEAAIPYFSKKLMNEKNRISKAENKKLTEKLIQELKDQGTETIKTDAANSVYTGGGKGLRKAWNKLKKVSPKTAEDIKDSMEPFMEDNPLGPIIKHTGKDTVVLGKGKFADADILAHEAGHSKYMAKGRSKNVLAKGAHKLMAPSKLMIGAAGQAVAGAVGYRSGLESARKKAQGEKESVWDKTKSVIIPAAAAAPLLIGEGAASVKGIKLLKKHGASKEALKIAKKNLGNAWGTYASMSAAPIVTGGVSRAIGKHVGKKKIRRRKRQKEEGKIKFLP